jgi:hypothetical protein
MRIMFPHEEVAEGAYIYVVRKLDAKCGEDSTFAALLSEGINTLQWSAVSEDAKLSTLEASAGTLFFKCLKAEFILWFYSNPEVWPQFGYEGPSNEKGGYVNRGFNNIDWIDRGES